MQMAVQAAPFTPLCDDGKVGISHETHEQQDVDMAGFAADKKQIFTTFVLSYAIKSRWILLVDLLKDEISVSQSSVHKAAMFFKNFLLTNHWSINSIEEEN